MDENPIPQPIQPPSLPRVSPKLPLVLLIVGVVAVGGYFASAKFLNLWPFEASAPIPTFTPRPSITSTVTDTSTWETYRSEEYGYEFKYPENWEVFEHTSFQTISEFDGLTLGIPLTGTSFDVFIQISKINGSLEQNYKEYIQEEEGVLINNTTINGRESKILSATINTKLTSSAILAPINDSETLSIFYGYVNQSINYNGEELIPTSSKIGAKNLEAIIDQILSTFKFIESIDISAWKTYTNAQYGFEFKYPEDWRVAPEKIILDSEVRIELNVETKPGYGDFWPGNLVRLDLSKNENKLPLDTFLREGNRNQPGDQTTQTQVAGAPGIRITFQDDIDPSLTGVFVCFSKDNSLRFCFDSAGSDIQILDKILSTFKFK